MKIALLGYGKMGKAIECIALERGHSIDLIIDNENDWDKKIQLLPLVDVAVDFSTPLSVVADIRRCFDNKLPVVVGTTGWNNEYETLKQICEQTKNKMFTASNFSIGVNIFFEINRKLAQLMNPYKEYDVKIEEVHHIHKLDKPSGTAITLADEIVKYIDRKTNWTLAENSSNAGLLPIVSKRVGEVPGTHIVNYISDIDVISIKHEAFSRKGFALGAVLAAEFIVRQTNNGIYSMQDLLAQT